KIAEDAYRCFEPYRKDEGGLYARAARFVPELCRFEVVHLLREIERRMPLYNSDHENVFSTAQNALVAVHAEEYYREMIKGGPHSWNIRDRHMAETLDRLLQFHGEDAKVVVWAHNTHVGDARATSMTNEGMLNIGELARLHYGDEQVVLVGFGSYKGQVIAGHKWGAAMQAIDLPPAINGSWEDILHKAGNEDKLLIMDDFTNNNELMENHVGHRAVGVVYNPEYELYSNYVPTIVPLRYDAFIFLDKTMPLYPLHIVPAGNEMPETYPFGV
ncbi:MAG TPA: erythromycin esterase family protein, partial [Chitinophagaceae bacterium]|nr:erythromycin esterase family protein [Chitinophagaceae bacterium]